MISTELILVLTFLFSQYMHLLSTYSNIFFMSDASNHGPLCLHFDPLSPGMKCVYSFYKGLVDANFVHLCINGLLKDIQTTSHAIVMVASPYIS